MRCVVSRDRKRWITVSVFDFASVDGATGYMLLVSAEMIALPQRIAEEAFVGEGEGAIVVAGRAGDKLFTLNGAGFAHGVIDAAPPSAVAKVVGGRL